MCRGLRGWRNRPPSSCDGRPWISSARFIGVNRTRSPGSSATTPRAPSLKPRRSPMRNPHWREALARRVGASPVCWRRCLTSVGAAERSYCARRLRRRTIQNARSSTWALARRRLGRTLGGAGPTHGSLRRASRQGPPRSSPARGARASLGGASDCAGRTQIASESLGDAPRWCTGPTVRSLGSVTERPSSRLQCRPSFIRALTRRAASVGFCGGINMRAR